MLGSGKDLLLNPQIEHSVSEASSPREIDEASDNSVSVAEKGENETWRGEADGERGVTPTPMRKVPTVRD